MSLKLNSSGGGSVTLQEPVTASDLTLNLPATLGGTGNSMVVTSDASGNVGVGVTPSAWGAGIGAMQFRQGGVSVWALSGLNGYVYANAYYDGATNRYVNNGTACSYAINNSNGQHAWFTAPSGTAGNAISFTQAMTLDSSGNLLVGTTSAGVDKVRISASHGSNANLGLVCADDVNGTYIAFRNSAATQIGSVSRSGTSSVAYNTSSDYRLKQNIAPMTGALAKVAALKPVTYKWKVDGSDGEGFIAHELQEVVPDAVTGAKDAVDADGKPVYQGIDTSFLVATLTAALQELKAELDTVKAELAAMKGTA